MLKVPHTQSHTACVVARAATASSENVTKHAALKVDVLGLKLQVEMVSAVHRASKLQVGCLCILLEAENR